VSNKSVTRNKAIGRQFNAMVGREFSVAENGITGEEAKRNQNKDNA